MTGQIAHALDFAPDITVVDVAGLECHLDGVAGRLGFNPVIGKLEFEHFPGEFITEFKASDDGITNEFSIWLIHGIMQALDGVGKCGDPLGEAFVSHMNAQWLGRSGVALLMLF